MKTHWKKAFNKDYLGAWDLESGKDLKAVIKNIEIKEINDTKGGKEKRNIAIFSDQKIKPMVLNVTACKLIRIFAKSSYIEDWCNIPISIYIDENVKAFGEITEGLRIRKFQPNMTKPKLTESMPAFEKAKQTISQDPVKGLERVKKVYEISPNVEKLLKQ